LGIATCAIILFVVVRRKRRNTSEVELPAIASFSKATLEVGELLGSGKDITFMKIQETLVKFTRELGMVK
jgi:hypothetical protein